MLTSTFLALALLANDPGAGIQTTTLLPQGAPPLERLGSSADVDTALAAVGAPEVGSGRVYLYRPAAGGHWRHVATLSASDGTRGDRFGASVAVVWSSPQIVVVGAPDHDGTGSERGAAYVFRNFGTSGAEQWIQDVKITPSNLTDGASFGESVAASGTTTPGTHQVVVGAPLDSSAVIAGGSAYLYRYTTSGAVLETKRFAPSPTGTGLFGSSVAAESTYAAVSQPSGSGSSGLIFVYRKSGSTWTGPTQVAPSDASSGQQFGCAIAMSSTHLAVGARNHDGGASNGGAAYVFERTGTNSWTQRVRYLGATANGFLGDAVDVASKPSNTWRLLVGQPDADTAWEATASGTSWGPLTPLAPFDGATDTDFGAAVAVGGYPADLVGAPRDDDAADRGGAVYVLDTATNMLVEDKHLPTHQHEDAAFGVSVAADGDRVVIGSSGANDFGMASGAAYVWERSGTTWSQTARLSPEGNGQRIGAFGRSVAVDGDTIAVGASQETTSSPGGLFAGAVYVFRFDGTDWSREARLADAGSLDMLGRAVALRGDRLAAGAPESGAGLVYVYDRSGTTWTAGTPLTPIGGGATDRFGASLAMEADTLVVGAPDESTVFSDAGAVHVFARTGSTWTHVQRIVSTNQAAGERFGDAVAVDAERLVVGAPGNDGNGTDAGAVYVYRRTPAGTYAFEFAGLPSGGSPQGGYGTSVAVRGNEIAVGAPGESAPGLGAGRGYLLRWQGFLWTQAAVMPPDDLGPGDFRGFSCAFAGTTLLFGANGWDGPVRPDIGAVQVFDVPPGNLLYCSGKTNSLGCVPFMTVSGLASASSTAPFLVSGFNLVANEPGFLLYGFAKANLGFHGGKLCIKSPFRRLLPPKAADPFGPPPCDGLLERNFNKRIQSGNDPLLTVGQTVFAQWRVRDPGDPAGFGDGLTDALRFTICP